MRFQILSHAGMAVFGRDRTLVCDPWILGSCYWRSWWNYPPVPRELIRSLRPDFIYLTHIHWDHFQGPSLRKFSKETQFLVPKGNYGRIARDLNKLGFRNVREVRHGEKVELGPDFQVTSYQFGIFLDSALVIECQGVTLLNANDAKFMGAPLKQILKRHPRIDFTFRSHSSANSRLSYEVVDEPKVPVDDVSAYIREFASFVQATGAKYAIPFASNHCHLHRDVFEFNTLVQTPSMVVDYFREHEIASPRVQLMVPGDAWSSDGGFALGDTDYFADRDRRLHEYQASVSDTLEEFYRREEKSTVRLADMEAFFGKFLAAVPWLVRRTFRGFPIVYRLQAGQRTTIFEVDVASRKIRELDAVPEGAPIVIETSTFIMRQCLKLDLFSHLSISKRVKYRVTKRSKRYVQRLNVLFNFYEYDWLPLRRTFRWRVLETYVLRWRELLLYAQLLRDYVVKRKLSTEPYLQPLVRAQPAAR